MVGKQQQRGDTLIEVLLAMVILSIMIIGALTLMSRGLQATQVAVEHTQVRNEMNGQAEMLRYLRDSFANTPGSAPAQEWQNDLMNAVPAYINGTSSQYTDACTPTTGKRAFYLSKDLANPNPVQVTPYTPTVPQTVAIPGQGMWIEATRTAAPAPPPGLPIAPNYIDFQIRACWAQIGSGAGQKTGTVVRLYDAQ